MKVLAGFTLLLGLAALIVLTQQPAPAAARDYDCADFTYQAEAEEQLLPGDPYNLDADSDEKACEDLPCPCSYTPGSGSTGGNEGGSTEATPPPPPPYHLKRSIAERISKHLVAVVVHTSARLQTYELNACDRLAEDSIDCRLAAHGGTARRRVACQYKVEVRAPNRRPAGRIASHKCRTASVRA